MSDDLEIIEHSEAYEDADLKSLVEYSVSDKDLPLCFRQSRHTDVIEGITCLTQTWRMKERVWEAFVLCQKAILLSNLKLLMQMKTVSVALVLCLNVGVDPPDVVKTQPCARLECWIGNLNATYILILNFWSKVRLLGLLILYCYLMLSDCVTPCHLTLFFEVTAVALL